MIPGRTGGIYIPHFRMAQMMREAEDKSSPEYQRLTWDALKKSINGLVNKVNATNIKNIVPELLAENLSVAGGSSANRASSRRWPRLGSPTCLPHLLRL
jgi:hypothetical protein